MTCINAVLWITRCSALIGEVIAVVITIRRTVDFQSFWCYNKASRKSISYVLLENGIWLAVKYLDCVMGADAHLQVLLAFCALSITTAFVC